MLLKVNQLQESSVKDLALNDSWIDGRLRESWLIRISPALLDRSRPLQK